VGVSGKHYFTAAELAALALPGLGKTKRRINDRAALEQWALKTDSSGAPLARRRVGRGGGLEYHPQLLPPAARLELAKRGLIAEDRQESDASPTRAGSWAWFEGQSEAVKAEAHRRLVAVSRVEAFERSNLTRSAAVACAADEEGVGSSTIWNWLNLVDGADRGDWLPHLAPRRKGGGAEATVDDDAFRVPRFRLPAAGASDLRQLLCARRGVRVGCAARRCPAPRRFSASSSARSTRAWSSPSARAPRLLRRTLPPQQRSVGEMRALELVNIDGHKFDVFVRFDDGRIGRPIMVAIQDVYSRKILAWRLGETENAVQTRLAFADLFTNWGIPGGCLLDNGRAFASKWITGGAKTRFRFKIREEEPTGLLTALGVRIHWATPYRGQSKPIERAFRDLADVIARHPLTSGAYTGNHIDAKPENYGSKAVPIEAFRELVGRGIATHNAKAGRRTETARGRSFDEVFEASYTSSPIGKATPEQLRLALLTADEVATDRRSGAITLFGNRYWSAEMAAIAGKKVTVRFDPDDLTLAVHVYDKEGRFLASVPVLEQTGFLDVGAAKHRARQERELQRSVRRTGELEELINAGDLAAMMPDHDDDTPALTPTVIRPIRHRGLTAGAAQLASAAAPAPAFIDRFTEAERQLRIVND
jgi:putative transposase